VAWDRDPCVRCGMSLSDRRFAAQLRLAHDPRAHKFDDLGCALLWLDDLAGEGVVVEEIWVRNLAGSRWLDARAAAYRGGQQTPMGYGFGASEDAGAEVLAFEEVRARVRAKERERRSPDR
jgi:hypothetical protein